MTWTYHFHGGIACWSLRALGVPDMQRFEQGCHDSSIRLLPTTVILDTSFRDRYVIRLLDQVDMAIIQWGIFLSEA